MNAKSEYMRTAIANFNLKMSEMAFVDGDCNGAPWTSPGGPKIVSFLLLPYRTKKEWLWRLENTPGARRPL
jgi:hypothetical protein